MTRESDLEAAILADPGSDEPRLVYGDWLQAEGDPRGELVTLQAERRRRPDDAALFEAEVALIDRLRDHLFGRAAPHLAFMHCEWKLGFVERLHVRDDGDPDRLEELVKVLLAQPALRLLRQLVVACDSNEAATMSVAALAERLPLLPLLDTLTIGDAPPLYGRFVGLDLAPLWPALERLRVLRLQALQSLKLPGALARLEELTVPSVLVDTVAAAGPWPALETLSILGGREEVRWTALTREVFPSLRHLRVGWNTPAREVASAPIAKELESLELVTQLGSELEARRFAAAVPQLARLCVIGEVGKQARGALAEAFGDRLEPDPTIGARVRHRDDYATYASELYAKAWSLQLVCARTSDERARAAARLGEIGGGGISLYNISAALMLKGEAAVGGQLAALAVRAPHRQFIRQAWSNLGISFERQGELATAALIARQGLLRYPNDPNLYAIYIDALRRTGRIAEAVAAVERARPLLPNDFSAEAEACLFDAVQTLIQAGKAAEALALVDETRTPAKRSPRLHAGIGLAYVHLGKFGQARKSLERAEGSGEPARLHAEALLCAKEGDLAGARKAAAAAKDSRYTEMAALRADVAAARKAVGGVSGSGTRSRARGRGRSR